MFLLILIAIGVYFYYTGDLQKVFGSISSTANGTEAARRVLDVRYASGEITSEEYTKIKHLLS